MWQPIKRFFLGRPLASEEAHHQLLPKTLALPVFASDPLSSNAYATEEILVVLAIAGASTFWLVQPLSLIIAAVVIIVIVSYRQTIHAYPRGGGSYMVARENLGTGYGLVAAASLLADYTLTVAVSIAAGVAAITSAAPGLSDRRVPLALGFIALVMVMNLRGVKESGALFAIPTYAFVASIWTLLVVGTIKCLDECPRAATADLHLEETVGSLTIFLVLRAFASGATALTGIEAVADGVAAFRGRRPQDQAKNAATTLGVMGFFTLSMFLGISFLARWTGVHPLEAETAEHLGMEPMTVVAQIADAVFGGGFMFFVLQAFTAGILILAANTAYADFPRLSSILAKDRFMPRQFMNRGDRLVFSNGVVVLSVLAGLLIVLFDASVSRLIGLYVVGVFTTFTLSQAGMVVRWKTLKPQGWRGKMILNAVGATTTGLVLVVVAISKFTSGAWITIIAIAVIVWLLKIVNTHYASVGRQLREQSEEVAPIAGTRAVLVVRRIDEVTLRAAGYAQAMRPNDLRAVLIRERADREALAGDWETRCSTIPLDVMEIRRRRESVAGLRAYIRSLPREQNEVITVVLPEALSHTGWRQFIRRRQNLLLKATLLFEPGVVVTDVPALARKGVAEEYGATTGPRGGTIQPARIAALVLVSAVHNAALRAVSYARSLSPTELTALTFNVDPDETTRVMEDWGRSSVNIPLEIVDAPYRGMTKPLLRHIRRMREQQPDLVVSVVIPEFVVRKWWHQFLHNQSALGIKAALLFEPGVVVTSVPFHLR